MVKRLSGTDQNSVPFTNVPTPSAAGDGTNKGYVDGLDGANVKLTGAQTIAGIKTFSDDLRITNAKAVTGASPDGTGISFFKVNAGLGDIHFLADVTTSSVANIYFAYNTSKPFYFGSGPTKPSLINFGAANTMNLTAGTSALNLDGTNIQATGNFTTTSKIAVGTNTVDSNMGLYSATGLGVANVSATINSTSYNIWARDNDAHAIGAIAGGWMLFLNSWTNNGQGFKWHASPGSAGAIVEQMSLSGAGVLKVTGLAGTGTRMVVASADGTMSTQTIPSGGGGTTRSVVSVTSATTLDATANTDYVALVGASGAPTMPTAVGNTNRYTVKNVTTTNRTIATTSSQTIDGSSSIVIRPNESVDLISDNANWWVI